MSRVHQVLWILRSVSPSMSVIECRSVCYFLVVFHNQQLFLKTCSTNWVFRRFRKLREVTITFFLSICPSVHPHDPRNETTRLPLDGFSWNLIFSDFRIYVDKIQFWLKSSKNNMYCAWRPVCICDGIALNFSWNEKCLRQNLSRN